MKSKIVLGLQLVILLICFGQIESDEHSHRYDDNEEVVLWMYTVGPYYDRQETYPYFSLPFCRGPKRSFSHYHETLSRVELQFSGLDIYFKAHMPFTQYCEVDLNEEMLQAFIYAVKNHYWYQMYIDDLPVWGIVGKYTAKGNYYLWTHKKFDIGYNGNSIVDVNLTSEEKIKLEKGKKIPFTYEINWKPSAIKFEDRFDKYLDPSSFQNRIHWFSILISFMMVIFFIVLVSIILIRTFRKDNAPYSKGEKVDDTQRQAGSHGIWHTNEKNKKPMSHPLSCLLKIIRIEYLSHQVWIKDVQITFRIKIKGNIAIMAQISENTVENLEQSSTKNEPNMSETIKTKPVQNKIYWRMVIISAITHIFALAGIFMIDSLKFFMYLFIISYVGSFGITAGVHRLWSHKTYKAKLPLRILLMLLNSAMFQGNIYVWSKNHRVHHKYSETDADPYNSKRGFFFSQIGWIYVRKHPDVIEKSKTIDVSDLLADPVVRFQKRYYIPLVIITGVIAPSIIPYYLWNVSMFRCFCICFCLRHTYALHATGLVNSAAHMWGYRPYNPSIRPAENFIVTILSFGEGFHNYHHTFPWDYSTSEYGWKLNMTTVFIDFMAWIGLAYDRKVVPRELVVKFKNKYNYKN